MLKKVDATSEHLETITAEISEASTAFTRHWSRLVSARNKLFTLSQSKDMRDVDAQAVQEALQIDLIALEHALAQAADHMQAVVGSIKLLRRDLMI